MIGIRPVAVDVGPVDSTGGTETGWPAPEHKDTTMLETAVRDGQIEIMLRERPLFIPCWSATSQACWTQGTTCATRPVFWQWHAKSVSSEQPSAPRAVVRQLSCEGKRRRGDMSV